jgi:carbamoyltransferase
MTNILGISGFENFVPFKKLPWPGLDEREYRISQGHDAAAVVIVDGEIVAATAEERLSRKKHSADFPIGAIRYCLDKANLRIEEIDEIAHGFDYTPYRALYSMDPVSKKQYQEVFSREQLLDELHRFFPGYLPARVVQVNHHLAHAASAYFTSGWDECLVAIIDGMGETQSATAYRAQNNHIEKLREIPANDSIGILCSIVTLHLGFDFNSDEYKIMGLAPYGNPARYRGFFDEAVKLKRLGAMEGRRHG